MGLWRGWPVKGHRRQGGTAAVSMALLSSLALPVSAAAVVGSEAPVLSPGQGEAQAAASTASAQAAASGEPVEVVAERTAYSTTTANPDGTFTLTQAAAPQRAKDADGLWRAVDATLERRQDGTVGPKAAVVDLAFSGGGGTTDLVRLGVGASSMALAWPGALPAPVLEGATATYPEVFDGVDLMLTATAEGYREVLVVKSAEAAANPALERVRLAVSAENLEIVPGAGGGLHALDEHGNPVFKGPAGQMWDSAGDETTGGVQPQLLHAADSSESEPEPRDGNEPGEDLAHPGEGDNSAILPVQVDNDAVTVEPDLSLLRGKETVYPVYIDPPVGLGASERTVISSDGDRFWDFDGEYGVGKCSNADGYYCGDGYVNRMLFEFAPSKLYGKYVLDATFRAYETWSFNCSAYWVDLERTDNISESTRWPGPKQLDQLGDRLVSAGRGEHCTPDQPDSWIEFNDNPDEPDENLATTVRAFADGKMSRMTFMLRAKDESEPRAWKRFDDNAELQVTYVPRPGTPTEVGLIPGDGTTIMCNKSESSPLIVTRTDPRVLARVQTQVQPKAGEEGGSLQAEFEIERKDTTWVKAMSDYRPRPGWDTDGTLEGMRTPTLTDGKLYRYKARTQSHWAYSGKSGNMFSSYSPWCYFKIDSTAPKAPQIASDGPYQVCLPNDCPATGGPGVPGNFTFLPNAADGDITGYRYRLATWTAQQTRVVPVGAPGPGQVKGEYNADDVIPSLGGTQTLIVEARDVRQRWGTPAEFVFRADDGTPETGRWRFDDEEPGSTGRTAKDTATEGTARHHATLFTDGAGWSSQGRRGDTDQSLWLDSTNPALQTGYAATAGAAVNTAGSFTVSTWVHMTNASSNAVVLSQPGSKASAFALYYSTAYKAWVFNRADKDQDIPVFARSVASQQNPPLRVWTHLAGVFDTQGDGNKANDTLQLFVNGRPQPKVVISPVASAYEPWTASGGLQFGRSVKAGAGGEYFHGLLDETAVWQRVLQEDEIAQEAALPYGGGPSNDLVGSWTAAGSTGTVMRETSPYYKQGLQLSSGAKLVEAEDALDLDGTSGYAGTSGPMVDETGSFTVSARVRLNSGLLAGKPVGYHAQVAGQRLGGESSWALWAVKLAQDTYQWKFTRTAVDSVGKVVQQAAVADVNVATVGTWVDVTGVFDAQQAWDWTDPADPMKTQTRYGQLRLYVGNAAIPAGETSGFTDARHGSGEMAVGRGGKAGTTANTYLPGALQQVRIWTGAMTTEQVTSQVLDAEALSTL
ncbi:LamG domain-containing protein [Streptomyces sp. NPDC096176]|uniref:LamG domain-containing protein n=1 Tax=Streptomyces sp. NPDC096176 TaxID=3366079 RepID=UPI00382D5A5E